MRNTNNRGAITMPHTQGRPHGRPQGRPHATEQTPGSTLEHAGYLWVLMVAALALCASILVISLNVVNADLPFYYRFQFATSLARYTAPSSRLELHPNLCMVRSAPACGTPVPLSTDSLPQCQVSCDGEGLCECKYLDEYPAYGREVLMGQNCSRAVAAVLETGECTCVEAKLIRAAFWLLATSTALMGAVPLVASVLILPCSFLCYCLWCMCPRFCQVRWERLCRSAGFRRAQARLMLLLIFAWQLGSVLCAIAAPVVGLYAFKRACDGGGVDVCGDGGLGTMKAVVIMSWVLLALLVLVGVSMFGLPRWCASKLLCACYLSGLLSAGSGQAQPATSTDRWRRSTETARQASAAHRGAIERWRVALEEASEAAETLAEAATADTAAAAAAGASHVLKMLAPYMTPCVTAATKTGQDVTADDDGSRAAAASGGGGGGSGGDDGGSGGGGGGGDSDAVACDCAAVALSACCTSSESAAPSADKDLCSICLGELSELQAT